MNAAIRDQVMLSSRIDRVLQLRIHSPATRNSIGPAFFEAAGQALREAQDDPRIGAIVIAGHGDFFSSGGNLHQLAAMAGKTEPERLARLEIFHGLIRQIRRSGKPVIMAVEGGAAGAGMSLALSGDLLISSKGAFFTAAYVKAGLTPDGGLTALLSESLPRQLVTHLCLTGARISSERLHEMGVVNELSDPGEAVDRAMELGRRLAEGPARATARILQLCDSAVTADLDTQLGCEAELMVQSLGDPEAREGIARVLKPRAG